MCGPGADEVGPLRESPPHVCALHIYAYSMHIVCIFIRVLCIYLCIHYAYISYIMYVYAYIMHILCIPMHIYKYLYVRIPINIVCISVLYTLSIYISILIQVWYETQLTFEHSLP